MNNKRKILIFELLMFFGGIPAVLLIYQTPVLKLAILLAGSAYAIFILYRRRNHREEKAVLINNRSISWSGFLIRAITVSTIIMIMGLIFREDYIFRIPYNTAIIPLIIIGYPLISVLPQEIIYRLYFFERYKSLFKNKLSCILINALFFGFLHIIYGNNIAVVFSLIGGVLFGITYSTTRSLLLTVTEHTVYGYFVFLSGYGQYFISENIFKILFHSG